MGSDTHSLINAFRNFGYNWCKTKYFRPMIGTGVMNCTN